MDHQENSVDNSQNQPDHGMNENPQEVEGGSNTILIVLLIIIVIVVGFLLFRGGDAVDTNVPAEDNTTVDVDMEEEGEAATDEVTTDEEAAATGSVDGSVETTTE